MDRNEEIKKISELLYNEYISNGWKNVSTEGCERQAINYIDVRDLVKKLTLTDVGSSFLWIVQDKESNILYTSFEKQKSIDRRIELIDKYKIPLDVNKMLVD